MFRDLQLAGNKTVENGYPCKQPCVPSMGFQIGVILSQASFNGFERRLQPVTLNAFANLLLPIGCTTLGEHRRAG